MTLPELINLFKPFLKPNSILSEASDLEFFGKDSLKQFKASPSIILLPRSTEEVSQIIKICNREQITLVPSGGRTGYSGGATATNGEVIISLSKMHRILEINSIERTLHCLAGATTESIQINARDAGLYYPVDFASRGSSSIAGNVATNAGGIRVVRYGSTKEWILGLTVVTGTGEILKLNGSLYKNQSGYDLRSLFIGSEGTLGIITEVIVRLTAPPKSTCLAMCAINNSEQSLKIMQEIRAAGLTINLIEYFERSALDLVINHAGLSDPFSIKASAYLALEIEISSKEDLDLYQHKLSLLIENGIISEIIIAQSSQQSAQLLALRERISETINKVHIPHKNDIALPLSEIPSFISELRDIQSTWNNKFEIIIFGHIGDGNLHLNVIKPENLSVKDFFTSCSALDHKIFELVQKHKGTISAEHGIGLLKKDYLHYSRTEAEINLMRQIKSIFDPKGILNPGKIFDYGPVAKLSP